MAIVHSNSNLTGVADFRTCSFAEVRMIQAIMRVQAAAILLVSMCLVTSGQSSGSRGGGGGGACRETNIEYSGQSHSTTQARLDMWAEGL